MKKHKIYKEIVDIIEKVISESDENTKEIVNYIYFKGESFTKYCLNNYLSESQAARKLRIMCDRVHYELIVRRKLAIAKHALVYLRSLC